MSLVSGEWVGTAKLSRRACAREGDNEIVAHTAYQTARDPNEVLPSTRDDPLEKVGVTARVATGEGGDGAGAREGSAKCVVGGRARDEEGWMDGQADGCRGRRGLGAVRRLNVRLRLRLRLALANSAQVNNKTGTGQCCGVRCLQRIGRYLVC